MISNQTRLGRPAALQLAPNVMVLLLVVGLSGCVGRTYEHPYEFIRLTDVPAEAIVTRSTRPYPEAKTARAIPVVYRFARPRYAVYAMVSPVRGAPAMIFGARSSDGRDLMLVGLRKVNLRGHLGAEGRVKEVFGDLKVREFLRIAGSPDVIRFEVRSTDGALVGQESFQYRVEVSGTATDIHTL